MIEVCVRAFEVKNHQYNIHTHTVCIIVTVPRALFNLHIIQCGARAKWWCSTTNNSSSSSTNTWSRSSGKHANKQSVSDQASKQAYICNQRKFTCIWCVQFMLMLLPCFWAMYVWHICINERNKLSDSLIGGRKRIFANDVARTLCTHWNFDKMHQMTFTYTHTHNHT